MNRRAVSNYRAGRELEFRKALAEHLLSAFSTIASLARVSPDLLACDLSTAVAQALKAPTLLFRKTFAVHSIECQGKPISLKSGFTGRCTEGM